MSGWTVPHREEEVRCAGTDTHLTFVGDGPPKVVFVPGTNFNAATCPGLTAALAGHWSTVIVDLPGQPGLSSGRRPRHPHDGWYGEILDAVLDALDADEIIAVGHSLGAAVVLAAGSPRIAGRVLLSPAGIIRAHLDPRFSARAAGWLLAPNLRRSERLLELFMAPRHGLCQDTVEWMDLVSQLCRSSLAPPPHPDAVLRRHTGGPMVVATGEYDRLFPPRLLVPGAMRRLRTTVRVLPGVGHLAPEERPQDLVDLVRALG